jgi:hypothetical protein
MRQLLLVSACLTLLLPTSLSNAALPKLKNKLIVPGESIGGAEVGAKLADAKKAWGKKGGKCGEPFGPNFPQCEYVGSNPDDGTGFLFANSKRKVNSIRIVVTTGSKKPFDTPLAKFKTKKGIGLGSTQAQIEKAYPKGKTRDVPGGQGQEFFIKGPGKATTTFGYSQRDNDPTQVITVINIVKL